jgi:hypothetical protein
VKLSALAVRLEKPFWLFICRHWHCDSRGTYRRRNFISVCEEGRQFSLARVEGWAFSLSWANSSSFCCIFPLNTECFIPPSLGITVGRVIEGVTSAVHLFWAACLLAGRIPIPHALCIHLVLRGGQRRSWMLSRPLLGGLHYRTSGIVLGGDC